MKHSAWQTLMGILLLFIVCVVSWEAGTLAAVENRQADMREEKPLVVIDAGHGGFDPGKVGIDGQLEKDINLSIAKKLKAYLEASDVNVVMTRDTDTGLYQSGDSHKKVSDMRRRCDIINEARPDLVVSIHQNSYHQEEINGGQVFYYKTSQNGNRRVAKANDNYYLLLHVKEPIVIVECGFLSNRKEAKALESEDYQDRMAWTIHMGVMEYLNTDEKQSK